jgi:hypothetical protein
LVIYRRLGFDYAWTRRGIAMAEDRGMYLDMDIYDGDWIEEVGPRDHWRADNLHVVVVMKGGERVR